MLENIQTLLAQATEEINQASDLNQLNAYRVHYLGKKSPVTELAKEISRVPVEDRPRMGQLLNEFKTTIQSLLTVRFNVLQSLEIERNLAKDRIDVTLPGRGQSQGHFHPISITRQRIESFFKGLGFSVVEGPEIEDDYHNFSALNIPDNHPARAMQDTFYIDDHLLLRTHMSPVQIRTMKNNPPPLRMIAPGRVYRRDFDVTHTPMFHQVEGLYVDHDVSFAHLKYVMQSFLHSFFERDIPVRFRSSYFPFTEPSAELDVQCTSCYGQGCRICSNTGWLEVVGCGMVHPNVLKEVNIDPEVYQGFAFGFGYDRLTMLYYGVNDLRAFFENDMRFLQQF